MCVCVCIFLNLHNRLEDPWWIPEFTDAEESPLYKRAQYLHITQTQPPVYVISRLLLIHNIM